MQAASADPPLIEAIILPSGGPFHHSARYVVTVEADLDAQYEFPDISVEAGRIEAQKTESLSEPVGENRLRRTQYYRIDPVFPGTYVLPALTLTWRKETEEGVLTVPSLAYEARELTEAEIASAGQFSGPTAPDAILAERHVPRGMLITGVLLCAGALAALYLIVRYRRQKAVQIAPALSPWETALNRLRELQHRNLPGAGKLDIYYVDLSSILRYYIEDRFHIHAPEQTTPEFIEAATACNTFTDAQQQFLGEFLGYCDRIKFARFSPGLEDAEEHFKQVRLFIKETIPAEESQSSLEQAA